MNKLDETLAAIAHMMDTTPGYTADETLVWRTLIKHVNKPHFERTGRIVVVGITPESIASRTRRDRCDMAPHAIGEALKKLEARGHLQVEMTSADGRPRYSLFLFQRLE